MWLDLHLRLHFILSSIRFEISIYQMRPLAHWTQYVYSDQQQLSRVSGKEFQASVSLDKWRCQVLNSLTPSIRWVVWTSLGATSGCSGKAQMATSIRLSQAIPRSVTKRYLGKPEPSWGSSSRPAVSAVWTGHTFCKSSRLLFRWPLPASAGTGGRVSGHTSQSLMYCSFSWLCKSTQVVAYWSWPISIWLFQYSVIPKKACAFTGLRLQ